MLTRKRIKLNFKGYETMKTKLEKLTYIILLTGLSLFSATTYAISLDGVSFASLPGDRVQSAKPPGSRLHVYRTTDGGRDFYALCPARSGAIFLQYRRISSRTDRGKLYGRACPQNRGYISDERRFFHGAPQREPGSVYPAFTSLRIALES